MYLGTNGYRVIAMSQQKLDREQYAGDLSGCPSHEYCFIGFFSLLHPPRVAVPDAVLKAQGAHIRVVMMTEDEPMAAKAVAQQVHIFTPSISDTNGMHTFASMQDANGQTTFSLYQNEQLLQRHTSQSGTRLVLDNHAEENEASSDKKISWYMRAWLSCRNQVTEPKSELQQAVKLAYIPYAVLVSSLTFSDMHG